MTRQFPQAVEQGVDDHTPVRCLMVPGLNDSGPDHWQSRWQHKRSDCIRVELDDWQSPTRVGWVERIDAAVSAAAGPVALVGHSLGCLAIAWWAAFASRPATAKVLGAMLVAPPDVGQQGCDLRLLRFAPVPPGPLPFAALVVASDDDRYATPARSQALAQSWNADYVSVGRCGHINAASGLGEWPLGQALLAELIADRSRR